MALPLFLTEHPTSVEETYGEHAKVAGNFAKELALAAMAAAVHAVFPALFECTASTKIKQLHAEMTSGRRADFDGDCADETASATAA